MSFEVSITPDCLRQVKRLARKYPSLKEDLQQLVQHLEVTPVQGTALGNGLYKIRLAIRSKAQGRSGGARVITCVVLKAKHVYVAAIYDKSEKSNLSDKELKDLSKGLSTTA